MTRGFLFLFLVVCVIILGFIANSMAGNSWGSSEYAVLWMFIFIMGTLVSWGIADEFGHY